MTPTILEPNSIETSGYPDLVNRFHALIQNEMEVIECPLKHTFTPGPAGSKVKMYARQITMPRGASVVSEKHETEHPFIVSKGIVEVRSEHDTQLIIAPFSGITAPGTQRLLFVHEETIWTTFHIVPEDLLEPDEIVRHLTAPRVANPYLQPKEIEP